MISNTATPRQALILAEQVRGLYGSTSAIAFGGFVLPPILVALFWRVMDHTWSLVWVAAVAATAGIWAVLLNRQFLRHNQLPDDAPRWLRYALIRSSAAGLAWGLFIITDATHSTTNQIISGTSLIGFGAITVSTLSYHPLAFRVFSIALFSPFVIWALSAGNSSGRVMAVLALGGLLYAMLASRNLSRLIVESLNNRFANMELIEQLQSQQRQLEGAHEEAQRYGRQAETARMEAVEANRAKSRFLAAASHDLRQPMHALGLFTSAVRAYVSSDQGQRIVDKIEASVGSTEVMFNALLDISRLDAGILVPDIKPIVLDELLTRLATEYTPRAESKGLVLRKRGCAYNIASDPALLERILRNFISNAIRYTRRGGLLLAVRKRGATVSIEAWDTGIGIPHDKLADIFAEFYQLGNPERDKANGLGLGLAIVKRIGELLDHPISVASRLGRGSRFAVRVPLATARGESLSGESAAPLDESLLIGATILVIDDEANVLEAIQVVLRQWGCHVIAATSQQQALTLLRGEDRAPDAILSDYRLRDGLTGIAAIHAIQSEWGPAPAALITGDTAPDRLKETLDSGYALLHKPLNPQRLKRVLCQMLARTAIL